MRLLGGTEGAREQETPLSLSLVAKKKAILQSELSKMDQRLRDRTAVLSRLRRHHEELLNVNGQLQQRNCLRKDKLNHLFESVNRVDGADGKAASAQIEDEMPDSAAVLDKCNTMKQLVESLIGKRELLEQTCMGMEDTLVHKTDALRCASQRLREASETLQLGAEDIRSVEWAFEVEQAAVEEAENSLRLLGQQQQLESLALEQSSSNCQEEATLHQELIRAKESFCAMSTEAYEQLLAEKSEATRVWKDSLGKLGRPGATCAKDEEVHQSQIALTSKLEQLTQSVATAKSTRRELVFRTKQEREMLSLTKSSTKAKEDQLEWLERQRAFLDCEYQNLISARTVNQAAHDEAVLAFKRTLVSLDEEKRSAKTTTQQVEDELAAANAALAALNGRLSKERKSLGQQLRKRNAKQKQLQSSNATLELVRADAKSAQATLEKARGVQQKHQAMLEKLVVENEDLKVKCAQLQDQNHDAERTLSALSADMEATSQLVESRLRTLTDTYLADSDTSDWHDVIARINKKVMDAKVNEQSKFQQKYAESAANLRSKYDVMFAALNEKFSRMLQEKQATFDATLQSMHSLRSNVDNPRHSASLEEASAPTRDRITTSVQVAKAVERGSNDQPRRGTADVTAPEASCVSDCVESNDVPEESSCPARDDPHTTALSAGDDCENMPDSRHHRDRSTWPYIDCSRPRSAGHFDVDPPSDTTTSSSIATPPLSSSSSTRPFASPLPGTSFTKKRDSTKKKLQLRVKPRRKPQDRRLPANNQTTRERVDSATSANRSSSRGFTSAPARQPEDMEAPAVSTEPTRVWTPPVMSSSQASLSPRHTPVADVHQRRANKEAQARHGSNSSRDEDRTSGESATRFCQAPSKQSHQVPTSAWASSSNNKENECPSATLPAPTANGHIQPKRPAGTSLSQVARSARAKHKSKKKIGTTIARKTTTKRLSLSGRKKVTASGALLSKTISGAGKFSGGIIDANSISSATVSNGQRRPSALMSDWFADDSFSFD